MEPKVIIQILENSKNLISPYFGVCYAIKQSFYSTTGVTIYEMYRNITELIPEFTRENAIKYAKANNYSVYWWTVSDIDNRIKFLDWLIEIYKNKL